MGANDKIRYWSPCSDGMEAEETLVTVNGFSQNSNSVMTVKSEVDRLETKL